MHTDGTDAAPDAIHEPGVPTVDVLPGRLLMLAFPVGQAYLWYGDEELTLVDSGLAGSGAAVEAAVRRVGRRPEELRRIVLTHGHQDHAGGAAELRARHPGIEVLAHAAEAPVVRGEVSQPPPVFSDAPAWERALWESMPAFPAAPPVPVDRELADGDTLPFGGGARVVAVPGHTAGSIALHLPAHSLLVTGDAAADVEGRTILGVFNTDRPRALASLRRMAGLGVAAAVFGHGEPITSGAAEALAGAVAAAEA
jgi:glyoxylase-like metal-dependent hydrolase (beta-lactamase superfamily II)